LQIKPEQLYSHLVAILLCISNSCPDEKPLTRNYGKRGSRMDLARKALHAIKQAIKLYIEPLSAFLFSYQSMRFKMMCAESWRFSYPGNSITCKDYSALVCTSATL
jgi:hypothetical protein